MSSGISVRTSKRLLAWAAGLQLAQGIVMEGAPLLGLLVILVTGGDPAVMSRGFSFVVPYFDENLPLMMALSGVFATLRVVAAIGLLRNRMSGYALSLVIGCVTLVLMVFMLPAGIADGVLSGAALMLLMRVRYGTDPIVR
ncbi:hypothetical protein [Microbacterium sp. LMI1-1-1.1]|uniref:hypothetical protein n=1 Tax=Microbacterium sp. LMI1-1-1.1 TaxID=3135223 RepID=UPI0034662656